MTGRRLHVAIALAAWVCAAPLAAGQPAGKAAFDSSRAWEHLRQIVAIGPRPSGSAAIDQTRKYIQGQLKAVGITFVEQAWDQPTPIDQVKMVNVIATIPGARRERVIIAGHYDTKLFKEFRFVGASDGGSSAAFLIEMGRVLNARKNAFTMELLFLDGEEARLTEWKGTDNTYGSRHYVASADKDGSLASAKALILIDMIGDRDLTIRREANSTPWLTDIIWTAASRVNGGTAFMPATTQVEDDHLAFLAARVPSVDIIDLDYPQWHTAADTLDAVSARSLQVVGDTLVAALPQIESRLASQRPR